MRDDHVHAEIHVREHPLPGGARLFHLTLSDGTLVSISTQAGSHDRRLAVTPRGEDEPVAEVRCSAPEATTLAALL